MAELLRLHALEIGHGGRPLGRPIDLALAGGQVLCVLGPNGCGKTTLFRTLLGLLPALRGRVQVAGQDLGTLPRAALARLLAYVPQAHAGVFAFSVEDVVVMGRSAHLGAFAMPSRADRAMALEALERLGIGALRAKRYTEISGGERQLVLIARALAQQARLLVMDEPTASLDFGNQLRVLREIAALRDSGIAVLVSTHQPGHALRIADRVALMKEGSLLGCEPPEQAMQPQALASLYGLRVEDIVEAGFRAGD
ncbi:ABC transporter ATP-binding protein [Roseateles sp.]|uniref:ABC transporter ATP-binding protein n=1 Tax=Roseateles sp. TaxID=1971397 RepID=UPI0039E92CBA